MWPIGFNPKKFVEPWNKNFYASKSVITAY